VFRFAQRITVLVQAKCWSRGRLRRSQRPAGASVYLANSIMAELSLRDVRAVMANRGPRRHRVRPARARALRYWGRNGVGKTTLLATIMAHDFSRGEHRIPGKRSRPPVYERCRLGVGLVPQTRDIFPSLTVTRTSPSPRARRWTWHASTISFPSSPSASHWATRSPAASSRCSPSGGADGQPDAAAHGRAARRARAII